MSPISWAAILTHGPAIVAAAKRLLATAGETHDRSGSINARLAHLENSSIKSARVLQEIAEQVQALALAQQQTARKVMVAIYSGLAAIVIGIGAGILAVIW